MTGRFALSRRAGLLGAAGTGVIGLTARARVSGANRHKRAATEDPKAEELLPTFAGGWGLIDPNLAPDHKPVIYDRTRSDPAWLIAQWGVSGPKLSQFRPGPENGTWIAECPTAKVLVGTREVILAQHGGDLECDLKPGKAREFDLLISPAKMPHQPISKVRRITLSLEFEAKMRPSNRRAACKITQGATLVAFVLGNLQAKQTLFYQVHFQYDKEEHHAMRAMRPRQLGWWWKHNPFGVDNFLGQGRPRVSRSISVLPLLRQAIDAAPPGLDRDLRNWTLNSTYAGQHIWGGTTVVTTWRRYSLKVA